MGTTVKQTKSIFQNQSSIFESNKLEDTALLMDDDMLIGNWVVLSWWAWAVTNWNEALRYRTQIITAGNVSPWFACSILWQHLFLIRLGSMAVNYQQAVRVSGLSDWTNTYVFRTWWGDVIATAWDYSEWIYFEYNQSVSPNWLICSSDWWVRTKADSWVPVTTSYVKLWFSVDSAWTLATYTINWNVVGTINTNIPIGSWKEFWLMQKIERTAWTGSRQAVIDWVKCLITYNNWR